MVENSAVQSREENISISADIFSSKITWSLFSMCMFLAENGSFFLVMADFMRYTDGKF